MLTPNTDRYFNILPSVTNQIFNTITKYSMKRITAYMHLPLNFELNELEIWRFSAPFYGFYYDRLRKNFSLWVNLTLKKNYGFMAPLFYKFKSMSNYKRFWYINSNSWAFFSHLFKKSLRVVNHIDSINILYSTKLHNTLSKESSFFESSEIAIAMGSLSNKNNWLIEESIYELDHFVSTYDKFRYEAQSYSIDRFRNKPKNFYNMIDSAFMSYSLYTLGYANNHVVHPRSYFGYNALVCFVDSVSNISLFNNCNNNSHRKYFITWNRLYSDIVRESINTFSYIQQLDSIKLEYIVRKFFGFWPDRNNLYELVHNDIIASSVSWHYNIPNLFRISKLYAYEPVTKLSVWRGRYIRLINSNTRLQDYLKKHNDFIWHGVVALCNSARSLIKNLLIKIGFKKYDKRILFIRGRYIKNDLRSNISYTKSYYSPYKPKLFKSWVIACRWHLNFILARFNRHRLSVASQDSNMFMRRPHTDEFRHTVLYVFFYQKNKHNILRSMIKYIIALVDYCAKSKWNFFVSTNIFYDDNVYSNNFYRIMLNYLNFIKGKLITWTRSGSSCARSRIAYHKSRYQIVMDKSNTLRLLKHFTVLNSMILPTVIYSGDINIIRNYSSFKMGYPFSSNAIKITRLAKINILGKYKGYSWKINNIYK